jgi:hypothetical protein
MRLLLELLAVLEWLGLPRKRVTRARTTIIIASSDSRPQLFSKIVITAKA